MKTAYWRSFITHIKPALALLGIICFSLLLYAFTLIVPVSLKISGFVHQGEARAAILMVLLLYPAFKRSGWLGELWSLSLTMVLFALALSWFWNTGVLDGSLIGGLLPWSDAQGYYSSAQLLLVGERLSALASRRPLFSGLLSVLLGITQHNLQLSLAILGALTALACYLLARKVRQSEGPFVGTILLVVMVLFYRIFIGKILTEHLGLMLGAFGLGFIWWGTVNNNKLRVIAGIMVLALALNARAGAFIVLPMLVLWGTWAFRDKGWFSKGFLLGSIVAILFAFLINGIVLRSIGSQEEKAFSNFSYSLYGIASGYKSWSQANIDHPQATEAEIYTYALELIRTNPLQLVRGISLAYVDFFNPRSGNAFSFTYFKGSSQELPYKAMFLISGLGLLWSILNVKDRRGSLIVAFTIGILLSVPFVPPIDSDSMRAYAATIPFMGLLLGMGAIAPARWLRWAASEPLVSEDHSKGLLYPLIGLIVVLCTLGPIIVRSIGSMPEDLPETSQCPQNSKSLTLLVNPGSTINLVDDSKISRTHLPNIRISDFQKYLNSGGYAELIKVLREIPGGKTIISSINYQDSKNIGNYFLVVDTAQINPQAGLMHFCARVTENEWLKNYSFYIADPLPNTQATDLEYNQMGGSWVDISNTALLGLVGIMVLESGISIYKDYSAYKTKYSSTARQSFNKRVIWGLNWGKILIRKAINNFQSYPKHIKTSWILIPVLGGIILAYYFAIEIPFSHKYHLEIDGSGQKNPSSNSTEVWLIGFWDGKYKPIDLNSFELDQGWEMKYGALLYNDNQPRSITWEGIIDGTPSLSFVSHPWSGIVTIRWNDYEQTVDLYSDVGRETVISPPKDLQQRILDTLSKVLIGSVTGLLFFMITILNTTLRDSNQSI